MSEISFGSTFKIPVQNWGVNKTKQTQLKSLVGSYSGEFYGKGKDQFALLSMANKSDFGFEKKLHKLGYYDFQKFDGEKIPKNQLLEYVNSMIAKVSK